MDKTENGEVITVEPAVEIKTVPSASEDDFSEEEFLEAEETPNDSESEQGEVPIAGKNEGEDEEEIPKVIDSDNDIDAEPPTPPQPAKVSPETQKIIDEAVKKRLSEITSQKNKANEELENYKSRVEESIKGFQEEGETAEDALIRIGAENAGLSVEDFKQKIKSAQEEKSLQRQKAEAQIRAIRDRDLHAIKQLHPEVAVEKIEDLDQFPKLAKLISTGMYNATDAYEIVYAKEIAQQANAYEKQKALNDSRSHLKSTKNAAPSGAPITKAEFDNWKGCYPNLSDKELIAKIRKSKN